MLENFVEEKILEKVKHIKICQKIKSKKTRKEKVV